MKPRYTLTVILMMAMTTIMFGQQKVGINTTSPIRPLEIYGNSHQYMRIHSPQTNTNKVGLEFIRGDDNNNARDWRIESGTGSFKIVTGTDNFATSGEELLRISDDDYVGIGTTSPIARLHIDGGEDASNTLDGYLMLGSKTGNNLIMDQNEIMARVNGAPATLYIQPNGGQSRFDGGNVYMGQDGGKVSIGDAALSARLNVKGTGYQVQWRNEQTGTNDWYMGASSGSWSTGDDLLGFSPNTVQSNSTLRLKSVTENDGNEAPVMISSPSTQTLFFDGNEIDSETPLYINHNSDENTYINPTGGKVGVANTNPDGLLHIKTDNYPGLGLQRDDATWWLTTVPSGNINIFKNTDVIAYITIGSGEWVALSDRNLKENIREYGSVKERIEKMRLCSYRYTHARSSQKDIGVIAQEVETLFPEAVRYANDQYGVAYDELTTIAIKGIQEQQVQLEEMYRQVDEMLESNDK